MTNHVSIWASIRNAGDGSAYIKWFLSYEKAENDQHNMDEGWGELCVKRVETYTDSNIHKEATENEQEE